MILNITRLSIFYLLITTCYFGVSGLFSFSLDVISSWSCLIVISQSMDSHSVSSLP